VYIKNFSRKDLIVEVLENKIVRKALYSSSFANYVYGELILKKTWLTLQKSLRLLQ
jgi:hypothetical protein